MAQKKSVFNWQLYLGLVLVITGGLFLADQLLGLNMMSLFWPLLIVLFGLTFFVGMIVAGKRGAGLAIPGALVSITGLLLFVQNLFDLWVTWTYAWALLICAVGLGMLIMNIYLKREGLRRAAGIVMGIGLVLFVVFGILFEIILNLAGTDVQSGVFLGAGLILLGLFVVFSRPLFARKHQKPDEATGPKETIDGTFEDVAEMPVPGVEAIRPLADEEHFNRINFKSVGEVFLVQGDSSQLVIEGDQNLIENVKIDLANDQLTLTYKPEIGDWSSLLWVTHESRLRYFVTVKDLKSFRLAGAGRVRSDGLKGESLDISHTGLGLLKITGLQYHELDVDLSGLGSVTLAGEVEQQNLELSGGGEFQAEDLHSQEANISISGAGSARVWVEKELNAAITGAGNIHYKGDPEVIVSKSGLGHVKPI